MEKIAGPGDPPSASSRAMSLEAAWIESDPDAGLLAAGLFQRISSVAEVIEEMVSR